MAALTDRELTQAAGRIHEYGDQRPPVPGAAGTIAAAAAAICAGFAGHAAAAALASAAFVALLGWLGLYLRIAAPINRRMTKAARDHDTPADIRADAETVGLNHHHATNVNRHVAEGRAAARRLREAAEHDAHDWRSSSAPSWTSREPTGGVLRDD